MQTQCPECSTRFKLTQQQLNVAGGQVRCAQCQTVFDGYQQLINEADTEPPELTDIVEIAAQPAPAADPAHPLYASLLDQPAPAPRWGQLLLRIGYTVLSLLLLALLLLQLAYIKRQQLVTYPALAPYVQQLCAMSRFCEIPVRRALEQFQLESRQVYTHPNAPQALVVTATFRNRADFNQPYPALLLSLSNVQGREIAARLFQPREYLSADTDLSAGIDAQQSVSFSLQLSDPGNQATAFEIDFQ